MFFYTVNFQDTMHFRYLPVPTQPPPPQGHLLSELSSDHSATDLPGHFPPALTINCTYNYVYIW